MELSAGLDVELLDIDGLECYVLARFLWRKEAVRKDVGCVAVLLRSEDVLDVLSLEDKRVFGLHTQALLLHFNHKL